MTSHLLRIVLSFALMLVAYFGYALTVVPFVEPKPVKPLIAQVTPEFDDAGNRLSDQVERYRAYFPPDSPELDKPIILENNQVALLIKEYSQVNAKQMRLVPCTMLFFPEGRTNEDGTPARAILMQAAQGAVLDFDQGFDLRLARLGNLLGGSLVGQVTIRSVGGTPGKDDELLIVTRDVQLKPDKVIAPHEVQFQFGASRGSGKDLVIELLAEPTPGRTPKAPKVQGVRSIALGRDVSLTLQANDATGEDAIPTRVTCQGAFHFNVARLVATFSDHVDVVRSTPDGHTDQLSCELLAIHFEDRTPIAAEGQPEGERKRPLEPVRIEASGHPVVVTSSGHELEARGEHIEYDVATGRLQLEGGEQVFLRQANRRIETQRLEYTPDAAGGLGEALAVGPGQVIVDMQSDRGTSYLAKFESQMRLQPHEGRQWLSLLGQAMLVAESRPPLDTLGGERLPPSQKMSLAADEIWFSMVEHLDNTSPRAGSNKLRISPNNIEPHAMVAKGRVVVDTPQLAGKADQVEVWFDAKGGGAIANARDPQRNSLPTIDRPAGQAPGQAAEAPPTSKYHVTGDLVRMQVRIADKAELVDLSISGAVSVHEQALRGQDANGLSLSGDQLEGLALDSPNAKINIVGTPARIEAKSVSLSGEAIQLARGENRMWIDGAGEMTLPVKSDLQGKPLDTAQPLTLRWSGKMQFDGRRSEGVAGASFHRDVQVFNQHQKLTAQRLDVLFQEAIDFNVGRPDRDPQVRSIACQGETYLENVARDSRGELASLEKMQLHDLAIDQQTGAIRGNGPGWLSSVRRGSAVALGGQPANPPASDDGLNLLLVHFEHGLSGNINRREVTFSDQVRCLYTPIAQWHDSFDIDHVEGFPAKAFHLTCDDLTVSHMGTTNTGEPAIELMAKGNTRVEADMFSARADRISYAAAKKHLVMEGIGQSDAHLWRQARPGAKRSHLAAKQIKFWHDTNEFELNGAKFLDLSEIGAPPRR